MATEFISNNRLMINMAHQEVFETPLYSKQSHIIRKIFSLALRIFYYFKPQYHFNKIEKGIIKDDFFTPYETFKAKVEGQVIFVPTEAYIRWRKSFDTPILDTLSKDLAQMIEQAKRHGRNQQEDDGDQEPFFGKNRDQHFENGAQGRREEAPFVKNLPYFEDAHHAKANKPQEQEDKPKDPELADHPSKPIPVDIPKPLIPQVPVSRNGVFLPVKPDGQLDYRSFVSAEQWESLTGEEVENFDFTQFSYDEVPEIAEKYLRNYFESSEFNLVLNLETFKKLPFSILEVIAPFFRTMHWRNLDAVQIQSFDFTQISKTDFPQVVKGFLDIFRSTKKEFNDLDDIGICQHLAFEKISIDSLYLICKYFKENHWTLLGSKQIEDFDFSELSQADLPEVAKNFINYLFSDTHFPIKNLELFEQLSFSQLKYLAPYLREEHWQNLSSAQIKDFNFAEIEPAILPKIAKNFVKHVFYEFEGNIDNIESLQALPANTLKFIFPYFRDIHWGSGLTADQVDQLLGICLDEKIDITPLLNFMSNRYGIKAEDLIGAKENRDLKKNDYKSFTKEQWLQLKESEILNFDFAQVNAADLDIVAKNMVSSIFYDNGLSPIDNIKLFQSLSFNKLRYLARFFEAGHWQSLTPTQIKTFDFTKIEASILPKIAKDFVVNVFYEWESENKIENAESLQTLSANALKFIFPYFKDAHWQVLDPMQTEQLSLIGLTEKIDLTPLMNYIMRTLKDEGQAENKENDDLKRKKELPVVKDAKEAVPLVPPKAVLPQADLSFDWGNMTEKEIEEFDFSKIDAANLPTIAKAFVRNLFRKDDEGSIEHEKILKKFSKEKIRIIAPYFSDSHWLIIDPAMVKEFVKTGEFDYLTRFLSDNKVKYIKFKLDLNKIIKDIGPGKYPLPDYTSFTDKDWAKLEDIEIERFDFSQIKKADLPVVAQNFVNHVFLLDSHGFVKHSELIGKLSYDNLIVICKYFKKKHWLSLTENQIKNFDFEKIDVIDLPLIAQNFVDNFFFIDQLGGVANNKFIQELSFNNLKLICKYFKKEQWNWLSKSQIQNFKFHEIDQADLPIIAKNFVELFLHVDKKGEIFQILSLQDLKLNQLTFICKYFKKEHWLKLKSVQAKKLIECGELDYSNLTNEEKLEIKTIKR